MKTFLGMAAGIVLMAASAGAQTDAVPNSQPNPYGPGESWGHKADGKPYKVEGNPIADTMTYKKVDEHTNKITGKKDGKTVVTSTVTVAKDGKSRVVTTTLKAPDGKSVTDKAYYDKE